MLRAPTRPPRSIGKYLLFDELASGGMATIYLGRLDAKPYRCLAIKRMHPQFSRDPEFVAMFLDEARLAARVRHPNVVPTIDVERVAGEIVHVMPYVHGESLSHLLRSARERGERVPLGVASAIMIGALEGLNAAHEAQGDDGRPLEIVHRDVSPQNILVGSDGISRVLDFGVAKAAGRLHSTRGSEVKGKFAYMSPEQVARTAVDRRTDVWAASVVLWEIVTGERLFAADNPAGIVQMINEAPLRRPSEVRRESPPDLDAVVAQGLARDPRLRFSSARALASALSLAVPPAPPSEVGAWVQRIAQAELFVRASRVAVVESTAQPVRPLDEPSPNSAEATAPGRGRVARAEEAIEVAGVPKRRTGVVVAAVIGIVVLGSGVGILVMSKSNAPATTTASASATATATATATMTATTTASATATASTDTPSASASATIARTARPPMSATTSATRPNCNPPFRFDRDGTKIPKPECL